MAKCLSPVPYPSPVSRAPRVPGPWRPSPIPTTSVAPLSPFPCVLWLKPQVAPGSSKSKCVCLREQPDFRERRELRGVTPLFPEP